MIKNCCCCFFCFVSFRLVFFIPNYCFKRQSCVRGNQRSGRTQHNISFIHHKNELHLKYLEMEVFLKITLCLDELKLLSNISGMALAHGRICYLIKSTFRDRSQHINTLRNVSRVQMSLNNYKYIFKVI